MNKVHIRVPASSANLGPGFDTLGLAYELYNEFAFEKREDGFSFVNFESQYCNEENPIVVAFEKTKDFLGVSKGGFQVALDQCEVPISSGLGSSSTLIIAGVLAANAFFDGKMSKEDLLKVTTLVEGHPDNVCAGLFGGLTMAMSDGNQLYYARKLPEKSLNFTLFVPDFHLSTEKARGVLPATYSRPDVVFNLQHALLLWEGLQEGSEEKIATAIEDKIHVPYRKSLIAGYEMVEKAAKEAGAIGVTISGAGPTILAISKGPLKPVTLENWQVFSLKVCETGSQLT